MRVVDRPRGCREGEQVIDRGGDLGGTLIAVPHHAGDPPRVGGADAHDPADLFAQGTDLRPVGRRVVVVVDRRPVAGQMPDGERKPALELIVIVTVEEVVLAIVLVVQYGFGASRSERN